ncbi:MAG: nucleotidyltransferase family protein [Pseudomonadota bacterium]
MTSMSAMVLAAGLGTRIRTLDPETPKPLIKVAGKPLIAYAMETLAEGGGDNFVVNVHHRAEQLESYLSSQADHSVQISDEREQLLETGGGIVKALPLLGDCPFFCTNTDAIMIGGSTPAAKLLREAWTEDMDALLLMAPLASASGYAGDGDFSLAPDGQIATLVPSAPFVFTGLQILRPSLFEGAVIEPVSTRAFWTKARERGRMYGVVFDGTWMHVGDPEGHRIASERLASR